MMRRFSYSTWAVDGPNGPVYIRRHGRRFLVGKNYNMIPGFFTFDFKLKREAGEFAWGWANICTASNHIRKQPESVVSLEACT